LKKPPRELDWLQIVAGDKPPGYRLLADFLAQLGHEIPRNDVTERLATAFIKIWEGKDAARTLELKWTGRGRPRIKPGPSHRRFKIAVYIAGRIESDPIQKGARERAFEAAATHFGRRGREFDRRELDRIWADLRDEAIRYLQIFRDIEREVRRREPSTRLSRERNRDTHKSLRESTGKNSTN
jgi:hypothetical protein